MPKKPNAHGAGPPPAGKTAAEEAPQPDLPDERLARLEQLFEHAPLPYQSLDGKGRFLAVNQAWLELLGYEAGEVLGRSFLDFLPPAYRDRFNAYMQSGGLQGAVSGLEIDLLRKDGSPVTVRHHGRLIRDAEGGILRTHCLLEDISDRKRMESDLHASRERYQTLVEQQNDLVVSFDPQGMLQFASPSYCRTFGVTPEEIVGQVFLPFVLEEDRESVQRSIASLSPENPTTYHEERALTADGIRWLGWSAKALFDARGELREIISVGRDITQRKQSENALDTLLVELEERVHSRTDQLEQTNRRLKEEAEIREKTLRRLEVSERRYRSLHESMRDGFGVVDMNGVIVDSNTSLREMLGYSAEELHGMTVEDITHERWHDLQRRILTEQVLGPEARGYSDIYEKEYVRKDGSVFPAELRSHLVLDEEGAPAGYWAIVRDISQRKAIEEALQQAKQGAEAASRAKSAFLARMSHELRTPLNAVINLSELAMDEESAELRAEYLQAVHDSGKRLLKVVNVVLDYARLDSGTLELEHRDFNLYDVLSSVISFFQPQVREKGLTLDLEFGKRLHRHFRGDPVRLQQVLINIVSNAVKYTRKGGVRVSVHCGGDACPVADGKPREDGDTSPARALLHIAVEDTGVGIEPERMHSLFEAFEQDGDAIARHHDGAGLGLPLSRRLVELMGGFLECGSEPGVGTTVDVALPLEIGEPSKAFQQPSQMAPRKQTATQSLLLDINGALQRFGGDRELYLEIGRDFMRSLDERMASLRETASQNDFETLALVARSLQGNCATIGAEHCRQVMEELEDAAREERNEAVATLIARLERVLQETADAFEDFRLAQQQAG